MPLYNEGSFIRESLQSVLDQTYSDFECIIIDDCSTDDTLDKIESFDDPRIRLIKKEVNSGYTTSLNLGILEARGRYIARMDGDDYCYPERFEKQVAFLEENLDYVLCGSQYMRFDDQKAFVLPEEDTEIKTMLIHGNQIIHPSVMMRRSVLIDNGIIYNVEKEPAEDYDLWARLLPFGKLKNLKEPLIKYRVHTGQISNRASQLQKEHDHDTRLIMYSYLDLAIDEKEKRLIKRLYSINEKLKWSDSIEFILFQKKMKRCAVKSLYDVSEFDSFLMVMEYFFIKKSWTTSQENKLVGLLKYLAIKLTCCVFPNPKNGLKLILKWSRFPK